MYVIVASKISASSVLINLYLVLNLACVAEVI